MSRGAGGDRRSGAGPGAGCVELRRRLDPSPAEIETRLDPGELTHLAGCPACRAWVARHDPTILFALLAMERKEEIFWTGFSTRVLSRVRSERPGRGGLLGLVLRPRFLALSGAAVLIAALALNLPDAERGVSRKAATSAPPPARLLPLERDAASPAPVESVVSSTARVISINVRADERTASLRAASGAAVGDFDVVLIVDQEIDI